MNRLTKLFLYTALASLTLGLSGCTGIQTTPSMVDYSYVPPTQSVTVLTTPGIEAF